MSRPGEVMVRQVLATTCTWEESTHGSEERGTTASPMNVLVEVRL